MSGLAPLLAGRLAPGVYHWESVAHPHSIAHTVESAGWRFVLLDTWTAESKPDLLSACAGAFGFPDWANPSFDALLDALQGVRGTQPDRGVVVVWDGWSPLARAEPGVFQTTVEVFGSRVGFQSGGPFAVLLRGAGPDTGLPELDSHPH